MKELPTDEKPDMIGADDVEASRAPLLEHLKELRTRLIWALVSLAVAAILCFFFADPIYNWLLGPLIAADDVFFFDTETTEIYSLY